MPAYETPELIEAQAREAEAAIPRVALWMAKCSLNAMLHIDANAAAPYGGRDALLAKLEAAYRDSLSRGAA